MGRREEGWKEWSGDCWCWTREKTRSVVLVKRGMLNKEIAVFPNDLKPAEAPEGGLPRLFMDRRLVN